MRALFPALAATLGSVAFQMSVSAGYLRHFSAAIPWFWGLSASLWAMWLVSHEWVTKGALREWHIRMGWRVYLLRFSIFLLVLFSVALPILWLTKSKKLPLAAASNPVNSKAEIKAYVVLSAPNGYPVEIGYGPGVTKAETLNAISNLSIEYVADHPTTDGTFRAVDAEFSWIDGQLKARGEDAWIKRSHTQAEARPLGSVKERLQGLNDAVKACNHGIGVVGSLNKNDFNGLHVYGFGCGVIAPGRENKLTNVTAVAPNSGPNTKP